MKTLKDLNTKIWYRLLKVLYLVFLFWVLIIGILLSIFEEWVSIDKNETKIICYSREDPLFLFPDKHISFNWQKINNLYLSNYNFKQKKLDYKYFINYNDRISSEIVINCINENRKNEQDFIPKYNFNSSDIYYFQKSLELKYWENSVDEEKYEEELEIFSKLDVYRQKHSLNYSVQLFDIIPKYKYGLFILLIIWYTLWVLLFFELIRRIFYYIVLWTLFPKKD